MRKVTPLTAITFVVLFCALFLGVDWLRHRDDRVLLPARPGVDGLVRIDVSDLEPLQVRFYRFLNPANQEVRFLVGRDEHGVIQVAFDAGDSHYKVGRGFSHQDGWIIDNKCETTTRLSEVNAGGSGCKPTPLAHQVVGDELVLREADILAGWRYFR
jgi:uncharacterized membrane protein